jgi:hypothetical protein
LVKAQAHRLVANQCFQARQLNVRGQRVDGRFNSQVFKQGLERWHRNTQEHSGHGQGDGQFNQGEALGF